MFNEKGEIMAGKRKKTAVKAIFAYILLSIGLWMFLNSYSNSYNRFSQEKIAPASLDLSGSTASFEMLEHSFDIDLSFIAPDSRLYCGAYLLAPDELRSACYLISICDYF